MVNDLKEACRTLTFIEDVEIVGSIASGCGLTQVSDLDIWILTNCVVDDMEGIMKKKAEDAGLQVSKHQKSNRILMTVKKNDDDQEIDVTVITNTKVREVDGNRSIIVGGLLLKTLMKSEMDDLDDMKQLGSDPKLGN